MSPARRDKVSVMKPNFALSLSFEGIRLLHRAAGGWRVVGEVALDAADMPGELAMLRRTATALEPGGLRTKLLLPTEQIKYLTIDTKDLDEDARMAAARAALDGATPYPVEDLAFDISADGDTTHVAAVARETLAEAEAFATEHRFHPTSFATVPSDSPYLGEPFFGPTRACVDLLGPGEVVEPDGIAVVVIGDAPLPVEQAEAPAQASEAASPEASQEPRVEAAADLEAERPDEVTAQETEVEGDLSQSAADAATEVSPPADPEDVPPIEVKDPPEEAEIQSENASKTSESDAEQSALEAQDTAAPTVPSAQDAAEEEPAAPRAPETDATADEPAAQAPLDVSPTPEAPSVVPPAPPPAPTPTPEPAPDTPSADKADDTSVLAPSIPTLPSLGAASRTPPPPSPAAPDLAAPTEFASRRLAAKTPARQEPVVTAPSLAIEPELDNGPVPPAALSFNTHETNAPAPLPPAPREGFLSRRKAKPDAAEAPVAAAATGTLAGSEAERMTVFGARREIGGKPRFLGLILTAALLVFLAGVAAWASVFLDDGLNLSRLFGERAPRVEARVPDAPEAPQEDQLSDLPTAPQENAPPVRTASLTPTLSEEDSAVLDALRAPVAPQSDDISDAAFEASYATTGIWSRAPIVPPEPAALISIDDLYLTSIDPISTSNDAVALPPLASFATDEALGKIATPAAAGTVFRLDEQGQVIATLEGALSPDGFTVYLGRPDLIPPPTPVRFQAVPDRDPARLALVGARPKARPDNLAETNERANLDGLTRSELAGFRPLLRPQSVQQQAEAAAAAAAAETTATVDTNDAVEAALATPEVTNSFDNATQLAIAASRRPDTRPRNFARVVRRAERSAARTAEPQAETRVAAVAPRVVTPKVPSSTTVAKEATVRNAINLRKINLIGVYGKPSSRRALVRLANGRYKKVVVGDRIDGGRVSAIGEGELRYNKSGRNVVLKMPRG